MKDGVRARYTLEFKQDAGRVGTRRQAKDEVMDWISF